MEACRIEASTSPQMLLMELEFIKRLVVCPDHSVSRGEMHVILLYDIQQAPLRRVGETTV